MSRSHVIARMLPTFVVVAVGLSACTSTSAQPDPAGPATSASSAEQRFPDVVTVDPATFSTSTTSVGVTVSSPYDSEARYADAVRVRSADGATVYGTLELTHDHAAEQPFTRSLTGLAIPAGVTSVVVEGHDQANGWGGGTLTVAVTG